MISAPVLQSPAGGDLHRHRLQTVYDLDRRFGRIRHTPGIWGERWPPGRCGKIYLVDEIPLFTGLWLLVTDTCYGFRVTCCGVQIRLIRNRNLLSYVIWLLSSVFCHPSSVICYLSSDFCLLSSVLCRSTSYMVTAAATEALSESTAPN